MEPGASQFNYRRLAVDTVTIQFGRALQVALNVATFILLARGLGPTGFGLFSTIVAVINTGYALADLGFGQLATRAVAQRNLRDVRAIQGGMVLLYGASSAILVASCVASWLLTKEGVWVLPAALLLGISYLHVQARLIVERGFWLGRLDVTRATAIDVVGAGTRLAGVSVVWLLGSRTITWFAAGIALAGVSSLIAVRRWLRYPSQAGAPEPGDRRAAVAEAAPFALSSLSWNGFSELPKMLLAPVAGATAVGQLGAATRLLNTAQIPLQSLLNVMTPRLFASAATRAGAAASRSRTFLRSMALVTTAGLLVGGGLAAIAPLLPLILGKAYEPAVPVLRILSVSLPFQALAFGAGDWLGGMGRQRLRVLLMLPIVAAAVPTLIAMAAKGAAGAALGYALLTALLACLSSVVCWRLVSR